MARVTGEKAPALTPAELEKLVDGFYTSTDCFMGLQTNRCPLEKGYVACHRQGRADPGCLRQAEHPLSETVGGPEILGKEDGGGPPEDGLPARKGCLSNPDPPDDLHTGGGLSGAGWALEGIRTAATRG
ncbi:hypothetical protein NDU88_003458 [Pleurodeles waltl]|uniref:Uncharacterized protein n=1 Tax=Pleurodeles waltl TaxID=8319 RepID=A0AAV7RF62_PLEWA|nr:hypothetical protein NDU88_003458 [Pleurodeles waltl]